MPHHVDLTSEYVDDYHDNDMGPATIHYSIEQHEDRVTVSILREGNPYASLAVRAAAWLDIPREEGPNSTRYVVSGVIDKVYEDRPLVRIRSDAARQYLYFDTGTRRFVEADALWTHVLFPGCDPAKESHAGVVLQFLEGAARVLAPGEPPALPIPDAASRVAQSMSKGPEEVVLGDVSAVHVRFHPRLRQFGLENLPHWQSLGMTLMYGTAGLVTHCLPEHHAGIRRLLDEITPPPDTPPIERLGADQSVLRIWDAEGRAHYMDARTGRAVDADRLSVGVTFPSFDVREEAHVRAVLELLARVARVIGPAVQLSPGSYSSSLWPHPSSPQGNLVVGDPATTHFRVLLDTDVEPGRVIPARGEHFDVIGLPEYQQVGAFHWPGNGRLHVQAWCRPERHDEIRRILAEFVPPGSGAADGR